MRSPFATIVAVVSGLVVLISYFLPLGPLAQVRAVLLDWAIILTAVAGVIAIFNLFGVHLRRIQARKPQSGYSWIVVIAFLATFVTGFLFTPNHPQFRQVVTSIQLPIETALLAVITISLAYAGLSFFQRRSGLLAVTFMLSALLFLVLSSGILSSLTGIPGLGTALAALSSLPLAGSRGILLGVALGSLLTGIRVLIGAHRPYSG